jgi:hypothetical protein
VPTKLVRRGRVCGYRPTREQLEEILELAQRGIDENPAASLKYSQGDKDHYSHVHHGKILPANVAEIIKLAGDPDDLNNLEFSINQDAPARRVDIQIGPGDWTKYLIESDDQTWAYGRYHELTERLLANRSSYAKGHLPRPEILRNDTDDKWRSTVWELVPDWRATFADNFLKPLWLALSVEIFPILVAMVYYFDPTNNRVGRADQNNAEHLLQWFNDNSFILIFITLSYIFMLIFLRRWTRTFLRSKVRLRGVSIFSQLSFRRNRDDAVQLIILYLTFLLLVIGVITLLL